MHLEWMAKYLRRLALASWGLFIAKSLVIILTSLFILICYLYCSNPRRNLPGWALCARCCRCLNETGGQHRPPHCSGNLRFVSRSCFAVPLSREDGGWLPLCSCPNSWLARPAKMAFSLFRDPGKGFFWHCNFIFKASKNYRFLGSWVFLRWKETDFPSQNLLAVSFHCPS